MRELLKQQQQKMKEIKECLCYCCLLLIIIIITYIKHITHTIFIREMKFQVEKNNFNNNKEEKRPASGRKTLGLID